jgi:hypothetical protein
LLTETYEIDTHFYPGWLATCFCLPSTSVDGTKVTADESNSPETHKPQVTTMIMPAKSITSLEREDLDMRGDWPTPDEIERQTAEIRAGWTPKERRKREIFPQTARLVQVTIRTTDRGWEIWAND